jgi:hypothetical protein
LDNGLRTKSCLSRRDRELRAERGVDLERVGLLVERAAEQRAAHQHQGEVDRDPQPDRAELGGERVDELHPHEREEAERGRPVAEPSGVLVEPAVRVAARDLREEAVDGADGADRPPHRPEEDGDRDQPDPPPDVEHAERRVGEQVLSEHRGEAEPGEADHPEHPQGHAVRRMVDQPLEGGRRGAAAGVGVEPRRPPGEREHGEGDDQRRHRAGDGELGWDGQVGRAAQTVGERQPVAHVS